MVLFFTFAAQAGHLTGSGSGDASTYEAITGDSPDEDRAVWDSFYKAKDHVTVKEPIGFLKEHIAIIKRGRAFVPAMGEGRNAIFLAKKGFTVDGVDLSSVAIERALQISKPLNLSIKTSVADLNDYHYPENYYDLIVVSLFYSATLIPKFKKALKRGGYLMFYNKLDKGPQSNKKSPNDFFVKGSELRGALRDLEIKTYREYQDAGEDVIGVLARKP